MEMEKKLYIDDVGSYPLVEGKRDLFDNHYLLAYQYLLENDISKLVEHRGLHYHFYEPIIYSFLMKARSGLDIINYPQHFSMHSQFMRPITTYSLDEVTRPFLIEKEKAIIPEVKVIDHYLDKLEPDELKIPGSSSSTNQVKLKICVTGPIELYIKTELGFTVYNDLLQNFSKSVNYFIKNSILNKVHLKTAVVAIDEPSLGFIDLFNIEHEDITAALDTSLEGLPEDVTTQIHLHSLRDAEIALNSKNIDVLTCEYASDPKNIISPELLEENSKKMRLGICRTNYNAIIGKMLEDGKNIGSGYKEQLALIDSEDKIIRTLKKGIDHYGLDNISYVGPDCGLSSWSPPQLASTLLGRVVKVVTTFLNSN